MLKFIYKKNNNKINKLRHGQNRDKEIEKKEKRKFMH